MPKYDYPDDSKRKELETSLDRKPDDFRQPSRPSRDASLKDNLGIIAGPKDMASIKKTANTEKLIIVNSKLDANIQSIDEHLLDAVFEKVRSKFLSDAISTHPTMDKILSEVDRKLQKKPEFVKGFISSGIRYSWIGFRKGSREFAGLEEILDGLHKKDIRVIAKGIMTLAMGQTFSTALFEFMSKSGV